MRHSKIKIVTLIAGLFLRSPLASASEYSHEPIYITCSEVHSLGIMMAGVNPAVGFFGMTLPDNREINISHNIHDLFQMQKSKVDVAVEKFDFGGIKSLKIVGTEDHRAYDEPATRRPPHYVGSTILTLELKASQGDLEIVEASVAYTNEKKVVVKKEIFDFSKYRLPGCHVQM